MVWRDEGSGLTKNKQREVGRRPKWAIILFVNIDRRLQKQKNKQTKGYRKQKQIIIFENIYLVA